MTVSNAPHGRFMIWIKVMPALVKTTGNLFLRGFSILQMKEVMEWQWRRMEAVS